MVITVSDLTIPTTGTDPKTAGKGAAEDAIEALVQGVVDQLGTAAEEGAGAFATAAQGAKADTAVQPAALAAKADLVGGLVPSSQLPGFVDDVIEVANVAALPAVGETGKIYVALDTNRQYRWGGSQYSELSASLDLGEAAGSAYRGHAAIDALCVKQT